MNVNITSESVVGMMWTGLTEAGALTTLLFGLVLGMVRITCDVIYEAPACGMPDTRPMFVKLHFMYYALLMFVVCVLLMCVISFFTEPVPVDMLGRYTFFL